MHTEINNLIAKYFENLIDTSLNYIPEEKKKEFVFDCITITKMHQLELKILLEQKVKNVNT
jgi:hypothetical protein